MRRVDLDQRRAARHARKPALAAAAAWALWLIAANAAPALACYTGLTLIPTAETVGAGRYGVELQFDGAFPARRADTRIINIQFGLGERLEAGLDYDLSREAPTRMLLNAKWVLAGDGDVVPAIAAGVCNVGRSVRSAPYAVLTQSLGAARGHCGAIRLQGHSCRFVGADHAVSERLTLMADCTSGEENHSSLGASYQFSEGVGVTAGALLPNGGGESRFTLHVVVSGPYRVAR